MDTKQFYKLCKIVGFIPESSKEAEDFIEEVTVLPNEEACTNMLKDLTSCPNAYIADLAALYLAEGYKVQTEPEFSKSQKWIADWNSHVDEDINLTNRLSWGLI